MIKNKQEFIVFEARTRPWSHCFSVNKVSSPRPDSDKNENHKKTQPEHGDSFAPPYWGGVHLPSPARLPQVEHLPAAGRVSEGPPRGSEAPWQQTKQKNPYSNFKSSLFTQLCKCLYSGVETQAKDTEFNTSKSLNWKYWAKCEKPWA